MNAKRNKSILASKPTLLRDQSKPLKIKSGLKAGKSIKDFQGD